MEVAKDLITKIIEATDMHALVSPYVKLQKSGSGFKGLCPFHQEKTPSFSVSQEKHLAKCFSCGKGGSPITFLMEIKHISFIEAVKELADMNNIKVDFADSKNKANLELEKYYAMNELANQLFVRNLTSTKSGKVAYDYLLSRGLDDKTIAEFKIGLAPRDGKMLYNLLKQSQYLEIDMVNLGLVRNVDNDYQDFFVNRITFPICDSRGRIIAFSGRDYTNTSQAKYMNSIETPVFRKNEVLYNLDLAINHISQKNRIILHEGYMDVIASYRSNLKEVVCSMGTQLTQNQINQIKRLTNNVIIAYDSDDAGIKATLRAGELLIKQGLNVSAVKLDKTKDSDEYVKKYGIDAYYNYFTSHIVSFIDYVFQVLFNNLDINNIIDVERVKGEFFNYLRLYNSNLVSEKYLVLLADKLGVSYNTINLDYGKVNKNIIPTAPINRDIKISKEKRINFYEYRIFDYAKSDINIAKEIDSFLEKNNNLVGLNQNILKLWQELINYYENNYYFQEEEFISILKQKNMYEVYYNMIEEAEKFKNSLDIPYSKKDLEDCLNKIASNANLNKLANLQKGIVDNSSDEVKKDLTLRKFELRKKCERK